MIIQRQLLHHVLLIVYNLSIPRAKAVIFFLYFVISNIGNIWYSMQMILRNLWFCLRLLIVAMVRKVSFQVEIVSLAITFIITVIIIVIIFAAICLKISFWYFLLNYGIKERLLYWISWFNRKDRANREDENQHRPQIPHPQKDKKNLICHIKLHLLGPSRYPFVPKNEHKGVRKCLTVWQLPSMPLRNSLAYNMKAKLCKGSYKFRSQFVHFTLHS